MKLLFGLTLACYVVSTLGYQAYLLFQKRPIYRVSSILLWVGFLCHTGVILARLVETGNLPVQNFQETLSMFGWAVAGVFLALQIKFHLMVLGALVAPLATLAVVIASVLPRQPVEVGSLLKGVWMTFHIGALLVGNAAFAIACSAGILYLIQERAIKAKKRGFFFRRLPSLKLLDSMGYSCLIVGFPMLTFGIITGAVYAQMVGGRFWSWDPKVISAAVTWLVFAALLHERLAVGWQGRRAAVMSIAGFMVFVLTFFLRFSG
ncbi:MAG: cytochrome c biogenesis protein CcsA [Desulfobacterales bacterium]|nr:cytochrome c biogenesis protein CcsA [Desulfobacterales bacterium]